jgi:hypothetical protein
MQSDWVYECCKEASRAAAKLEDCNTLCALREGEQFD